LKLNVEEMGDGAMKASDVKVGMVVHDKTDGAYYKLGAEEARDLKFAPGRREDLRPLTKRERGEGGAK
jgi:hypothetical protein